MIKVVLKIVGPTLFFTGGIAYVVAAAFYLIGYRFSWLIPVYVAGAAAFVIGYKLILKLVWKDLIGKQ